LSDSPFGLGRPLIQISPVALEAPPLVLDALLLLLS
jgi:hypothetical protein